MEQMKEEDVLPDKGVQNRFSVMYLSLRTRGVQLRLGLNLKESPNQNKIPVKKKNLPNLSHFARWIYGDDSRPPLFTDSRQVDTFGSLLENDEAFKYLCDDKDARVSNATTLAGGDLPETVKAVKKASVYIRMAISQAHHYKNKPDLKKAMKDFGDDAIQLMSVFRDLQKDFRNKIDETFKS
jgi:hypothetical protein